VSIVRDPLHQYATAMFLHRTVAPALSKCLYHFPSDPHRLSPSVHNLFSVSALFLSILHERFPWHSTCNLRSQYLPRSTTFTFNYPFTIASSDVAEGSSDSLQRLRFNCFKSSNFNSQIVAPRLPGFAHPVSSFSMPSQERIQYSNKESVKVNAGINTDAWTTHVQSAFSTNMPVVHNDFSQLIIPVVHAESKPSTEALVRRLLNPPPHAFVHGTISIHWVIGAVDRGYITFRNSDERYVLAQNLALRKHGIALGMPALYMEWLCGDDENTSATELGIHLTPEYFNKVED
jgi:hypothetical protein